jgi:cytoskeleton protein RodZ
MSNMSSVSEQLQQARQARNLTIEQVADITKIRGDHLRALESGNFEMFSAPVYIRGFTRTYSTLLKLNVPEIMKALDGELSRTEKFREPPSLLNRKRGVLDFLMLQLSKIDWRKGLATLIAIIVLSVVGIVWYVWRHQQKADPLKNLKPGVYHAHQSNSGETLPLPTPAPPPRR